MPTTFNTDSPRPAYVYDSTDDVWYPLAGVAPGTSVDRYYFTATSGATSISGVDNNGATLAYTAGTEQVYLNGVLLVRTDDYTATNGTSITGLAALTTNDIVEVITFNPSNIEKTSAILSTSINAKGDLIAGTADNTAGILSVGTAGQYLKVDSSTATGLTWGDPGDLTAVSAGTGITVTNGTGPIPSVELTTPVSATNGGTAQSTYTTGDMLYASAANTLAKLSIGTTSQTLTVVGGIPSWVTPAGNKTIALITSGSMPAASSLNITGITQDFLQLQIFGLQWNTGSSRVQMQVNSNTGSIYRQTSFSNISSGGDQVSGLSTQIDLDTAGSYNAYSDTWYSVTIQNCATTGFKNYSYLKFGRNNTNTFSVTGAGQGVIETSVALTSIQIINSNAYSYNSGTYRLVGG